MFRSQFAETIFNQKYRHSGAETWDELCRTLVYSVCDGLMSPTEMSYLTLYMQDSRWSVSLLRWSA